MITGVVPPDIANILDRQIRRLAGQEGANGQSPLASFAWMAFLVWSANRGMRGIVDALNVIYDRAEERPIFMRLAVTLVMTAGMIVFIAIAILAVLLLPAILGLLPIDQDIAARVGLLRWPALLILEVEAAALLLIAIRAKPPRLPLALHPARQRYGRRPLPHDVNIIFLVCAELRQFFRLVRFTGFGRRVHDLGAGCAHRGGIRCSRNRRFLRTAPLRPAVP